MHVFFSSSANCLFFVNSFSITASMSKGLDPDLSGLIWVQTVCKRYQQTTDIKATGRQRNKWVINVQSTSLIQKNGHR